MFKFNNNHIFTGYLKQVLASFNLPKCRVYTKEHQQYVADYENNVATWADEIKNLTKMQAQLAADISDINNRKETTTNEEYVELLETIKETYEEELAVINNQVAALQHKITTTPKELNILQTKHHSVTDVYPADIPNDLPLEMEYPKTMRYIPYIKDGYLQVYDGNKWYKSHTFDPVHKNWHKAKAAPPVTIRYDYDQKIPNYTKNLKIQNTTYDSYTHEYLGDYLRFHRDFANINLMPLYNCFSNRACPHLDLEISVSGTYKAKFKTDQSFETSLYKYYMVPVKFFKNYTIAIDCSGDIELCCCIYDEYLETDPDFTEVPKLTYQCLHGLQFKTPILYSGLQNLNPKLLDPNSDLCQREDDLKLILKVPVNNESSIVILEGNYVTYNDSLAKKTSENCLKTELNRTVINYENLQACEYLIDKLITPLQLLRANTGESYPFADRLVEYLVGNAITANETIADNIKRVKTVMSISCPTDIAAIEPSDGIWEPILQCLAYNYINNNENSNTHDINHDILGFVDKDIEKWYTAVMEFKRNKAGQLERDPITNKLIPTNITTIANVDIYKD